MPFVLCCVVQEQERLMREKERTDVRIAREREKEIGRLEAERKKHMEKMIKDQVGYPWKPSQIPHRSPGI